MDKNTTEIRIYAKQKLNIIAGSRYRIGHKINVAENNPVKISLISLYFVDKTTTTLKLGTVRQMCCGLYFSINTFQFNTSKIYGWINYWLPNYETYSFVAMCAWKLFADNTDTY